MEYSELDHLKDKDQIVKDIYEKLITELQKFGEIKIEPKKTSIHLGNRFGFAGVYTRKDYINLEIHLNHKLTSKRVAKVEQASANRFHHTIKLNDQSNGNFDWNFYQIQNQTTPVLQYLLLRDSISSGVWRTIAITSGNVNQISDPDYNLFPNASYRLVTNMGGLSCTPTLRTLTGINTSKSNIKNKAVGITENKLTSGNLILTPNPASKSVLLKSTNQVGVNSVQIFDKLGNVVFTKIFSAEGVTEYKLDIAELASAIYVVVVKGENFTLNKKLVVVQ